VVDGVDADELSERNTAVFTLFFFFLLLPLHIFYPWLMTSTLQASCSAVCSTQAPAPPSPPPSPAFTLLRMRA
jgi:hypothetical protein